MSKIYFCYGSDFLSNFHMKEYVVGGVTFSCVEQGFQYEKAIRSGDLRIAHRILGENSPYMHKKLGREVQLRDTWNVDRVKVMYKHCYHKFDQNIELKEKLIKTGTKELVECNRNDTFWACGRSITDPMRHESIGKNMLGRILMTIRAKFFDETFEGIKCL